MSHCWIHNLPLQLLEKDNSQSKTRVERVVCKSIHNANSRICMSVGIYSCQMKTTNNHGGVYWTKRKLVKALQWPPPNIISSTKHLLMVFKKGFFYGSGSFAVRMIFFVTSSVSDEPNELLLNGTKR